MISARETALIWSLTKFFNIIPAQGQKVDATQEIIALGVCNIVSSYFQSMLVNGSFSRSAVSNASGVKTPGSGIYTGIHLTFFNVKSYKISSRRRVSYIRQTFKSWLTYWFKISTLRRDYPLTPTEILFTYLPLLIN